MLHRSKFFIISDQRLKPCWKNRPTLKLWREFTESERKRQNVTPMHLQGRQKKLCFQGGLGASRARGAGSARWRLERAKGFEPSTPTLARLCSTPELRPRPGGGLYARTQCHDKPGRDVEPTIKTSFLHQKMVGLDKMARPAFKAPASP